MEYSDTETYTFHVGPMQDLEVRDGGSSAIAAGRTAYTILAANNGPEPAVDAEVKIILPRGAPVEDYVASEGTYADGVWTLPGLKLRDYRSSQGIPEEASLTLILKDDGGIPKEPATATISLTDNAYIVCIGNDRSTLPHANHAACKSDSKTTNAWHAAVCVNTADNEIDSTITVEATCNGTTDRQWRENVCAASGGGVIDGYDEMECDGWFQGTMYEHPKNNSEAKITARGGGASGTSGGPPAPGSPGMRGAKSNTRSVTLTWGAVKTVNTIPTGHYEVQKYIRDEGRETWQTVSGPVTDTQWTDFNVGSGTMPPYRVRAVNAAGIGGPW